MIQDQPEHFDEESWGIVYCALNQVVKTSGNKAKTTSLNEFIQNIQFSTNNYGRA